MISFLLMFQSINLNNTTVIIPSAFVAAYLIGSINFSIIASHLLGKGDLRKLGSKNAGATNLRRAVGWPATIVVFTLDLARAFAVILGAVTLGLGDAAPAIALPLLLGNLHPIFHSFRGGKGVAAAVGIILALSWPSMLLGGTVFLIVLAITRLISASSITMSITWPLFLLFINGTLDEVLVTGTISLVILLTHRANIVRIINGKEPTIGHKGTTSKKPLQ